MASNVENKYEGLENVQYFRDGALHLATCPQRVIVDVETPVHPTEINFPALSNECMDQMIQIVDAKRSLGFHIPESNPGDPLRRPTERTFDDEFIIITVTGVRGPEIFAEQLSTLCRSPSFRAFFTSEYFMPGIKTMLWVLDEDKDAFRVALNYLVAGDSYTAPRLASCREQGAFFVRIKLYFLSKRLDLPGLESIAFSILEDTQENLTPVDMIDIAPIIYEKKIENDARIRSFFVRNYKRHMQKLAVDENWNQMVRTARSSLAADLLAAMCAEQLSNLADDQEHASQHQFCPIKFSPEAEDDDNDTIRPSHKAEEVARNRESTLRKIEGRPEEGVDPDVAFTTSQGDNILTIRARILSMSSDDPKILEDFAYRSPVSQEWGGKIELAEGSINARSSGFAVRKRPGSVDSTSFHRTEKIVHSMNDEKQQKENADITIHTPTSSVPLYLHGRTFSPTSQSHKSRPSTRRTKKTYRAEIESRQETTPTFYPRLRYRTSKPALESSPVHLEPSDDPLDYYPGFPEHHKGKTKSTGSSPVTPKTAKLGILTADKASRVLGLRDTGGVLSPEGPLSGLPMPPLRNRSNVSWGNEALKKISVPLKTGVFHNRRSRNLL